MKSLRTMLMLSLLLSACRTPDGAPSASQIKEAPEGDNAPHWWGLTTMRYDDLPLVYNLPQIPWASDFWATFRGGIGFRWQAPANESRDYKDYLYKIPTAAQLGNMTSKQLNKLSAAEKYDVWMGRTDLKSLASATGRQRRFMLDSAKYNRDELGVDEIPGWTGICNGWSLAAINEPYPAKPVKVKAPNGKDLTFYSGDIQALASQIYFDYQPSINVSRLGALCDEAKPPRDEKGRIVNGNCRDVNPMSFHLALGRYLSKGKGFVFDVDAKVETWNQPAYGYKMALGPRRPLDATVYPNAAPGTVNLVDVDVTFHYIQEAEVGEVGLTEEEKKQFVEKVDYHYTLEIDESDMLVGGEWRKGKLPDFLWKPDELPSDDKLLGLDPSYPILYSKVKELINASLAQP